MPYPQDLVSIIRCTHLSLLSFPLLLALFSGSESLGCQIQPVELSILAFASRHQLSAEPHTGFADLGIHTAKILESLTAY